MDNTFYIYFSQLNEKAKQEFLDFCTAHKMDGVENFDILPIASFQIFDEEDL